MVRDLVLQERPLASILRILMSLYVSLSNLNFHVRTLSFLVYGMDKVLNDFA